MTFNTRSPGGFRLNTDSLESFSIECRKTKTKIITTANQNKGKYSKEPIRTQSKWREARENASDQVAIGFSFASDWLRK